MAKSETYVRNQLYSIPLADLQPDPDQPCKYFDSVALEELTASVARNSVMTPIWTEGDRRRGKALRRRQECRHRGRSRYLCGYAELHGDLTD